MALDRRQQALSVFGVVQYRKRLPRVAESVVESESSEQIGVAVIGADPTGVVSEPLGAPAKASVANSIQDLRAVADELGVADLEVADVQPEPEKVEEVIPKAIGRQFTLRFWRCGNLLAMESARGDDTSEAVTSNSKHGLANNIFRAIYGAKVSGATMYSHHWPDEVNETNSSDDAAREWLSLFLKGQKAKDQETKLWLMGTDVLELLLAEQGSPDELENMRIQDNTLGLEIYVTSSLEQMIAKPFLKAATWKLLRVLSPE